MPNKFKNNLENYRRERLEKKEGSRVISFIKHTVFGGYSRDKKLRAVNSLISALDGWPVPTPDKRIIGALHQGKLGKIVESFQDSLPEAFKDTKKFS